jgi:hypothetical protein
MFSASYRNDSVITRTVLDVRTCVHGTACTPQPHTQTRTCAHPPTAPQMIAYKQVYST